MRLLPCNLKGFIEHAKGFNLLHTVYNRLQIIIALTLSLSLPL